MEQIKKDRDNIDKKARALYMKEYQYANKQKLNEYMRNK